MEQILKFAENMVVQRLMSHHVPLNNQSKSLFIIVLLIGIFAALGVIFLMAGLYVYLNEVYKTYQAMTMFGLSMIILAIVSCLILYIVFKIRDHKLQKIRDKALADVLGLYAMAEDELQNNEFIQNNPKSIVLISALAGFIAGKKGF